MTHGNFLLPPVFVPQEAGIARKGKLHNRNYVQLGAGALKDGGLTVNPLFKMHLAAFCIVEARAKASAKVHVIDAKISSEYTRIGR